MSYVVNGRFLASQYPAGVHRAGRSLIDALRRSGSSFDVLAPAEAHDSRVDAASWAPGGQVGMQLWEQVVLPMAARRRPILSLANTGPLVASRHLLYLYDLSFLANPDWFRSRNNAFMKLVMRVARRADGLLVGAETVRGELAAIGFDPAQVFVVPLAVDDRFQPASEARRREVRGLLGLARPYVVHIGWGDPRKDVATAVAASNTAQSVVPHDLVLVGRPHPYFAPVVEPAGPNVRLVGRLDDDDLVALLSEAAALVYPSRYEGYGLPPLEALACGTPAIVSDIPVLRETVTPGAVFVGPGDVGAWAHAIGEALLGRLPVPTARPWSWDDAGRRLRQALVELSFEAPA